MNVGAQESMDELFEAAAAPAAAPESTPPPVEAPPADASSMDGLFEDVAPSAQEHAPQPAESPAADATSADDLFEPAAAPSAEIARAPEPHRLAALRRGTCRIQKTSRINRCLKQKKLRAPPKRLEDLGIESRT